MNKTQKILMYAGLVTLAAMMTWNATRPYEPQTPAVYLPIATLDVEANVPVVDAEAETTKKQEVIISQPIAATINDDEKPLENTEVPEPVTEPSVKPVISTSRTEENNRLVLDVPMVYQAPFGIWDKVHEDTCEEAAVLMVKGWSDGIKSYTRQEMENELLKMVDYQVDTIGYFESTGYADIIEMMNSVYGLEGKAVWITSAQDIVDELNAGHPVIALAAGKMLDNPNFTNGGPLYHAFVIKGYDATHFIVNEPGTRKGLDYRYPIDVVVRAIHDWNGGDVMNGEKIVIVGER